ncbi:MAG: sensor histidine kinase [Streptosporangiaceae bacterium]
MSRRLLTVLIAGAAAAVLFNVLSFYFNNWPTPTGSSVYVTVTTLVLVAYLGVGITAWRRHPDGRVGPLFTWVGYAWLLPSLTNLHWALPFTVGNLCLYLYQAALAHLALAWPYGRLRSKFDCCVVVFNYCWNIGNNAVQMLFWNPRTENCGPACPANLLLVHDSSRLHSTAGSVASLVGNLVTVAIVVLIARNWWSSRGYARRAMTWLTVVAVPIAAYMAILNVPGTLGLSSLAVNVYGPLILLLAPVAYWVGVARARRARNAVGTTMVGLEPRVPPARLREALALALGDPSLQLAFRVSGSDCYTDTNDDLVDAARPPRGRMTIPVGSNAGAVLVFDGELRHEPELVRVTAAAAGLALEHWRLQAEVQAQLEQVRASRARIVTAGVEERRRLERNLHDGAQQRLETLTQALALARSRAAGADPELAALIESASKEAREALTELRELARGIHPAVLTETGLAGAVHALAERSPVPTTVAAVPPERFAAALEATAYFVVSEALANVAKHAMARNATVTIRRRSGLLSVVVTDNGAGGASLDSGSGLRGLADRVASVGGVLQVDSPPGRGTRLQADIPCR